MKISKIFHFLYFSVMAIPLVTIPIFAIYSQNHEINNNTLEVQKNKVVDFNQQVETINTFTPMEYTRTTTQNDGVILTVNYGNTNQNLQYYKMYTLDSTHIYYGYFDFIPSVNCKGYARLGSISNVPLLEATANQINRFYVRKYADTTGQNEFNFYMMKGANTLVNGDTINIIFGQLFDLTLMFGEGYEPTIEQFNTYFQNSYYPYTESEEVVIENYETITYNDSDIMSQFMYQEYNFMDKYLGMYKYQPFSSIYSWLSNTFFGGSAPLVFTIFYQWFSYWLFVSLCWLIFDVLIYVPLMIHRWMDKGAIE